MGSLLTFLCGEAVCDLDLSMDVEVGKFLFLLLYRISAISKMIFTDYPHFFLTNVCLCAILLPYGMPVRCVSCCRKVLT